jgi:hypothetical protein
MRNQAFEGLESERHEEPDLVGVSDHSVVEPQPLPFGLVSAPTYKHFLRCYMVIRVFQLKGVSCSELNGARPAARTRNLPEVGVADIVVWVAVAGEVEDVEAIYPEVNHLPFRYVEILKQGAVDLFESGRTRCTNGCRTKRER